MHPTEQLLITERMAHDFNIIKDCLAFNNTIAIIIYGGYGRDEGSWIFDSPTQCRPYNDYDILLISKEKILSQRLSSIGEEIKQAIGIRWIDLGCKTIPDLQKMQPSIYNYDLKYASKVIYGDMNFRDFIPSMDSSTLPLREIETLYFTRLWTLLGSIDENGFSTDSCDGEKVRFFRNQMAKAILAIVDVRLLQIGKYHYSYNERVKRVCEYDSQNKTLVEMSKWALAEKLCPQASSMTKEEIQKLYNKVHQIYFEEMFKGLSKYYKSKIENTIHIERKLKWSPLNLMKRIGWLILRQNNDRENSISLKVAQSYIACAHSANYNDYMQRGIKAIKKIDPNFSEDSTWDEARLKIASLRLSQ
jgi:hypothetical protein